MYEDSNRKKTIRHSLDSRLSCVCYLRHGAHNIILENFIASLNLLTVVIVNCHYHEFNPF